jgi:hypothetical protein
MTKKHAEEPPQGTLRNGWKAQFVILNGVCEVKNPERWIMKTKDGGILRYAQNDKIACATAASSHTKERAS